MPRRVTRDTKTPPLPQRAGIDPVAFTLPNDPGAALDIAGSAHPHQPVRTVADFLVARFYPHNPRVITDRLERGEIRTDNGRILTGDSPYVPGLTIWYYRELPEEPQLPDDLPVLYEDEHVLAVDKPHFLPTTPRGAFVAQTALTKLRVREGNPLLVPVHRLDRATAGVLLFAKTVPARGLFQTMFARREVFKEYLAVARPIPDPQARAAALSGELTVRTRIEKIRGELQVRQWDQPSCERELLSPNATTGVRILTVFDAPGAHHTADTPQHTGTIAHPAPGCPVTGGQLALYRLRPHTGKTHQLRAHLHLLGAPIAGDVLYPKVLPPADAPELPLQLVAHRLEFEHPVTGEQVRLRSMRKLALLPS